MGDRDKWGLRGPVKTCSVNRTWYSRRCGAEACDVEERSDATSAEFRLDGSLLRQQFHNPDGSEWSAEYEYDDSGRLRAVRVQNASGESSTHVYEYDDSGRLVRIVGRSGAGDERVSETYSYDASGWKTKTEHVAPYRPNTVVARGVEGTENCYSAPNTAAISTDYDGSGRAVALRFEDAEGRLLSRVDFRYDEAGRLVEEAQRNTEAMLPAAVTAQMNPAQLATVRALFGAGSEPRRCFHRYDAEGRRIETRLAIGPLMDERRTMAYNEHADLILQRTASTHRDYGIDDEGRLSEAPTREAAGGTEARFRYEYDARGNWVEKVTEYRPAAGEDFSTSSVERREVTYYGDAVI